MKEYPSIFNDVVGPIMRGPSSSHTAAAWRIAKLSLEILNEPLKKAVIEFPKEGAWATNYKEQGTELGINGGLLGLDITNPLMKRAEELIKERGLDISYEVNSFSIEHPNTVRLSLEGLKGERTQIIAVSLGGGAFEVRKINQFDCIIQGEYYHLLIACGSSESTEEDIKKIISQDVIIKEFVVKDDRLTIVKATHKFSENIINELKSKFGVNNVKIVNPILPIAPANMPGYPFKNVDSLIEYSKNEKLTLGSLGLNYEMQLSGLSEKELISKMENIIEVINNSIKTGLQGTTYSDRILHHQSHLIEKASNENKILKNSVVNDIIANVTAIMESKSAMEVIVANPTAGSSGTVGGVIKAISKELNSSKDEIIKAYFAAGMVGVIFSKGPGFSAEEHGCQVECGAASGMAAAAIAQLFGGTASQAIDSASIAIQNMVGLICDPVADRVEVPCLGKNINAAVNALTAATMVCSGFEAVIPLDEVIETVSKVSKQIPSCLKCTGTGGLAITKTALNLKEKLKNT